MRELACRLRANQLFYHSAHNLTDGASFFGDHQFFEKAYKAHEEAYDGVVERMIANGKSMELEVAELHHEVATKLEGAPSIYAISPEEFFQYALKLELGTIQMITAKINSEEITIGEDNMLAGLADEAEKRIYKIQARLQSH